jgi:mRNA interferase MazF
VLIVQSNPFNDSRISTVVVAVITSNLALAAAPGNVRIGKSESGLVKPSVINVSQILTIDRAYLGRRIRALPPQTLNRVDSGMRLVLGL